MKPKFPSLHLYTLPLFHKTPYEVEDILFSLYKLCFKIFNDTGNMLVLKVTQYFLKTGLKALY